MGYLYQNINIEIGHRQPVDTSRTQSLVDKSIVLSIQMQFAAASTAV